MGVEYQHYLIPEDSAQQFDAKTIEHIVDVLKDNGIWEKQKEKERIYISDDGSVSQQMTNNGWLVHGEVNGRVVEEHFGGSRYEDVSPEHRSLDRITIIFGNASKIHFGSEEVAVAMNGVELVELDVPFSQPFYEMTFDKIEARNSTLYIENPNLQNIEWFTGWWKSAIIIDFGKDVPHWSDQAKMPKNTLLSDLHDATNIKFREIGNHY